MARRRRRRGGFGGSGIMDPMAGVGKSPPTRTIYPPSADAPEGTGPPIPGPAGPIPNFDPRPEEGMAKGGMVSNIGYAGGTPFESSMKDPVARRRYTPRHVGFAEGGAVDPMGYMPDLPGGRPLGYSGYDPENMIGRDQPQVSPMYAAAAGEAGYAGGGTVAPASTIPMGVKAAPIAAAQVPAYTDPVYPTPSAANAKLYADVAALRERTVNPPALNVPTPAQLAESMRPYAAPSIPFPSGGGGGGGGGNPGPAPMTGTVAVSPQVQQQMNDNYWKTVGGGGSTPLGQAYGPAWDTPFGRQFDKGWDPRFPGMTFAQGGAVPAQGGSAGEPSDIEGYMNGDNAIPPEHLDAILQQISQLYPTEGEDAAVVRAITQAKQAGDMDHAAAILAGLRQRFNRLNATAQGALARGNMEAAAQLASKAHSQVPDGLAIHYDLAEDGSVTAVVKPTGTTFRMSAQQFHDYLVGPATSFDHILENGLEKNLAIASGGQRGSETTGYAAGGDEPETEDNATEEGQEPEGYARGGRVRDPSDYTPPPIAPMEIADPTGRTAGTRITYGHSPEWAREERIPEGERSQNKIDLSDFLGPSSSGSVPIPVPKGYAQGGEVTDDEGNTYRNAFMSDEAWSNLPAKEKSRKFAQYDATHGTFLGQPIHTYQEVQQSQPQQQQPQQQQPQQRTGYQEGGEVEPQVVYADESGGQTAAQDEERRRRQEVAAAADEAPQRQAPQVSDQEFERRIADARQQGANIYSDDGAQRSAVKAPRDDTNDGRAAVNDVLAYTRDKYGLGSMSAGPSQQGPSREDVARETADLGFEQRQQPLTGNEVQLAGGSLPPESRGLVTRGTVQMGGGSFAKSSQSEGGRVQDFSNEVYTPGGLYTGGRGGGGGRRRHGGGGGGGGRAHPSGGGARRGGGGGESTAAPVDTGAEAEPTRYVSPADRPPPAPPRDATGTTRVNTKGEPIGPPVGQPVPAEAAAEPPTRVDTSGRPIGGPDFRPDPNTADAQAKRNFPDDQPMQDLYRAGSFLRNTQQQFDALQRLEQAGRLSRDQAAQLDQLTKDRKSAIGDYDTVAKERKLAPAQEMIYDWQRQGGQGGGQGGRRGGVSVPGGADAGNVGKYGRTVLDPDGWPAGVPRGGTYANVPWSSVRDYSEPVKFGRSGHVRSVGRPGSLPVYDASRQTYDVDRRTGLPLPQRFQRGFQEPYGPGEQGWTGMPGAGQPRPTFQYQPRPVAPAPRSEAPAGATIGAAETEQPSQAASVQDVENAPPYQVAGQAWVPPPAAPAPAAADTAAPAAGAAAPAAPPAGGAPPYTQQYPGTAQQPPTGGPPGAIYADEVTKGWQPAPNIRGAAPVPPPAGDNSPAAQAARAFPSAAQQAQRNAYQAILERQAKEDQLKREGYDVRTTVENIRQDGRMQLEALRGANRSDLQKQKDDAHLDRVAAVIAQRDRHTEAIVANNLRTVSANLMTRAEHEVISRINAKSLAGEALTPQEQRLYAQTLTGIYARTGTDLTEAVTANQPRPQQPQTQQPQTQQPQTQQPKLPTTGWKRDGDFWVNPAVPGVKFDASGKQYPVQ